MKISEAVKYGKQILGNDYSLDVEVLLAFAAKISREQIYTQDDADLLDDELFKQLIDERRKGKPVAYLIGKKEFYGIDFFVDERCLVPRPETEMIVDEVIEYFNEKNIEEGGFKEGLIFDVGTGSGAIGFSLAKMLPDCRVFCFDIGDGVAAVANKNLDELQLENASVVVSDLLAAADDDIIPEVIVANLPYIGLEKYNFVDDDVKAYEPHLALFGGFDGLDLYRKLFGQILERDYPGRGLKLIMGEFGFAQLEEIVNLIEGAFGSSSYKIIPDLSGIDRFFKILIK
ncbi:peptide chain release factor N(5)-glutamine methyltransferase [Patescibacteria group bacterium]|nr:peptide chain release factor N(5)-glutamine methyltransferase [Patescibacteria group bacterium]